MRTLLLLCALSYASALYSSGSAVENLDTDAFNKKVKKSDEVWLVEFFAPWCGHCKSLVPEWEKSAKALKGIAHIAAVDATVEGPLAQQFGVGGYPTILIFGADKDKPEKYSGGRTADAITAAALKAAKDIVTARLGGKKSSDSGSSSGSGSGEGGDAKKKDSNVVTLTADNFDDLVLNSQDPWMIEFYAPWCGHCKNLAPEWEKLANDVLGTVKVGAVDATIHSSLAGQYGVNGYPTLKFFRPGKKDGSPDEIQAGRTASALGEWVFNKLDELGHGAKLEETSAEQELKDCISKKGVCVVAFLPHIIDTGVKGRNDYIETLSQASKKMRGKPLSFTWVQGGTQSALESAVGVGGFGYPALVSLNSKNRYSLHRGAYEVKAISEYLDRVLSGRAPASELKNFPPFSKVDKWDGGEYVSSDE